MGIRGKKYSKVATENYIYYEYKSKTIHQMVGGKGQLIEQLEAKLPADFDNWDNATYIEPFVGGGAMLFYMLQQHPNIKRAVINDICGN